MSLALDKLQSVIAPGRREEWGGSKVPRATWRLPPYLRSFIVGVTAWSWTAERRSHRLGITVFWHCVFWCWIITSCSRSVDCASSSSLWTRGAEPEHPPYALSSVSMAALLRLTSGPSLIGEKVQLILVKSHLNSNLIQLLYNTHNNIIQISLFRAVQMSDINKDNWNVCVFSEKKLYHVIDTDHQVTFYFFAE